MSRRPPVFLFFFISGFCGLVYQTVWLRLAFAHFGVITPILSVVLSVFMAGLAIGSWWTARLNPKNPLRLYALAELFISAGAVAVPLLLRAGELLLLRIDAAQSWGFFVIAAGLLTLILLPWCVAMGATVPLMMAAQEKKFSFLYLANVVGAACGVFISAHVLIELFGFTVTGLIAGGLNLAVGISAWFYARTATDVVGLTTEKPAQAVRPRTAWLVFTTGFVSLGLEITLTRLLTPLLGTTIYAFAAVLFIYLVATAFGAWWSRSKRAPQYRAALAWLPFTVVLPLLCSDARWNAGPVLALASVAPFFLLTGFVLPRVVDEDSGANAALAGKIYALNLLGCVAGPLVLGYALLPLIGAKGATLLLGLLLVPFVPFSPKVRAVAASGALLALLARPLEEGPLAGPRELRRDYAATVVASGSAMQKQLRVNGVGLTYLSRLTKWMAHLPMLYLPHQPKKALAICFGMGTTYRSLLAWGIDVTAVELIPSVPALFPFFYEDAVHVAANPRGRIVIDDGRRFLQRTSEKYDVICIDPPPPVEAAASSLLYSQEFYALARARLAPGGIVQQWFPGGEKEIGCGVVAAMRASFPYVLVIPAYYGHGFYLLGSDEMPAVPAAQGWEQRLPAAVRQDILEWGDSPDWARMYSSIVQHAYNSTEMCPDASAITDDKPLNEYFLLRRLTRR